MRFTSQRLDRLIPFALLVFIAVVYLRVPAGGFVYDDYYLVETNPALRDPGSLVGFLRAPLFAGTDVSEDVEWAAGRTQYWRPFVKLVFWVQYRLHGLDASAWHVWSLVIHLASVLLLDRWLMGRLKSGGAPDNPARRIAAGFGALLFAVHPVRTEAVAWISGSADLWMTFWVLVGLVLWRRPGWAATALAAFAFALAALCKETAFIVPVCLAIDAVLLPDVAGARIAPSIPAADAMRRSLGRVALVAATLGVVFALRLASVGGVSGLPRPEGGSVLPRALACLGLYVGRILVPLHPSTQIGLIGPEGRFEPPAWSVVAGIATLAGILGLILAARRYRSARPLLADLAWFVVPLVPVLQLVPLDYTTLVAERFLSLPFLGVAALFGRGLGTALDQRGWRPAVALAAVAACAGCAVTTAAYVPAFRSNTALWRHELELRPSSPYLHLYAARAARSDGSLQTALHEARAAYERARHPDTRAEAALTWARIRLQMAAGRETRLLQSLADFFAAWAGENTTGDAGRRGAPLRLAADGQIFEAEPSVAFRMRAMQGMAFRSARAVSAARAGRYSAAAAQFESILRSRPSAAAQADLARALACDERWDEAAQVVQAGLAAFPKDATLAEQRVLIESLSGRRPLDSRGWGTDATGVAAARVQLWLALGSTLRARRELQRGAGDPDVRWSVAEALVDAADGDPKKAERSLQSALLAARQPDGAYVPLVEAALREVQRPAPDRTATPRPAGVDALFR